jgi:NAD(P)H dehydrogenase (quinone)
MFGPGSLHGRLDQEMLRHFLQGTLGYVGLDVYEPFFAYFVPYTSDSSRESMLTDLGHAVADLPHRPVLPMPRLEDFDNELRPLS